MSLKDLVMKNRSFRRFQQDYQIERDTLLDLVDHARLSASGNFQALKFFLSNAPEMNDLIFPQLGWAAYLKDWGGPAEGEQPSAYIIILGDTTIRPSFGVNPGIAAQSITLAAAEKGLGGCMIGTIRKGKLAEVLNLPGELEIQLVIALGKPTEVVFLEDVKDGDIKYWRDQDEVHHVPKRSLDDLVVN